jgi:hypothetical protein
MLIVPMTGNGHAGFVGVNVNIFVKVGIAEKIQSVKSYIFLKGDRKAKCPFPGMEDLLGNSGVGKRVVNPAYGWCDYQKVAEGAIFTSK